MMTPSTTYTATCWREDSSWVVRIPELDRSTRAARFSQVEGVARDLVDRFGGAEAASARVVTDLRVPDGLVALLAETAIARLDRDQVSVGAVTLRRTLARRLTAEGFPVRDVAALLGLSIGRAQVLIGEAARPHIGPVRPARRIRLTDKESLAPLAEAAPRPVHPH
jgi:hypothetical protein